MTQGFLSRWSRRKQAAAQAAEAVKVVETPKSPPHPETAAAQVRNGVVPVGWLHDGTPSGGSEQSERGGPP